MQHSLLNLLGEKNYGGQTIPQKRIGRNLVDFPKEFVILDIETTGLSPHRDEIIELSALLIRNDEIVEEFNRLVKPEGEISAFISNLTGITPEMVADAPDIATAIKDFDDFCVGKIVLGHNITFDISFIDYNLQKYHGLSFSNDFIDSLRLAKILLPQLQNRKLGTLANFFGFNTEGMHRGLKDCKVTHLCYCKFKEIAARKNGSVENFLKGFKK